MIDIEHAMNRLTKKDLGEQGFAAIVIAVVLVVVLSLVTVGFASLMRTEQRSALDRQLSNSAYYAAESGINDASAAIRAGYNKAKTQCDTSGVDTTLSGHNFLMNPSVNTPNKASYTCLLINPYPADVEYSSLDPDEATSAIITGSDSTGNDAAISKLVFSWQDASGGNTFAGAAPASIPNFPPVGQWLRGVKTITGVLRVSLTPIGAGFDRNSLESTTYTAFLYPQAGGNYAITGLPTGPDNQYSGGTTGTNGGVILNGNCNTANVPRYCQVAVTNLGQTTYLMRLTPIYYSVKVTVTPFDSTNSKIYIKGAQTLIDSTGKAQDVLRRIQVRLPARNAYDYPAFNLATGGNICKQLTTYPPNQAIKNLDPSLGNGNTISACNPL